MKILVADDTPDSLEYLQRVLLSGQHDVVTATNGQEAWNCLQKESFDCVITDLLMPGLDGFELCKKMKSSEELSSIPCVFLTATYTKEADREFGRKIGAAKFLAKPAEPDFILAQIEEIGREGKIQVQPAVDKIERRELDELHLSTVTAKLNDKVKQLELEQKALANSEAAYRSLVSAIPIGVLQLDVNGKVQFVNDQFNSITGLKNPASKGAWLRALKDSSVSDSYSRWLEALESYQNYRNEVDFTRPDGSVVCTESQVVTTRGDDNEPSGHIFICMDITEKKKLEKQLLHSQKMEAVGELSGGIAHDLRNMLMVINGQIELMQEDNGEGNGIEGGLASILKATDHANGLVSHLLAFSRKQDLSPELIDIDELIRDSAEFLSVILSKNIVFDIKLNAENTCAYVDPMQLKQVIVNIAMNANDAMPTKGKFSIETNVIQVARNSLHTDDCVVPAGEYVAISLRDTGAGMTPDTRSSIFLPFFTSKETGTGLGLPTCYGIIRQSGGYILVDSILGEGTELKILMPPA